MANTILSATTTGANEKAFFNIACMATAASVTVDWGDGTDPELVSVPSGINVSHVYETAGTYDIEIKVEFGTVAFIGSGMNPTTSTNVSVTSVGDGFYPGDDPDEYDPSSISNVPGDPAPEQNLSGDALQSIITAYGKNLKYIKTENNVIAVNVDRAGMMSISSDDLVIRTFNGYDFLECRSYDPFFGRPYYSLIRVSDIRTFVIAQNANDQIDAFRC
jgi:hypothetical protein